MSSAKPILLAALAAALGAIVAGLSVSAEPVPCPVCVEPVACPEAAPAVGPEPVVEPSPVAPPSEG